MAAQWTVLDRRDVKGDGLTIGCYIAALLDRTEPLHRDAA